MKTKKSLTVVLVLALVLSITVMAFATDCGHADYSTETVYTYPVHDSSIHVKVTTIRRTCNTCGEQTSTRTQVTEGHTGTVYEFLYDYSESGEDVYVYNRYCACTEFVDVFETPYRQH